jgi:hypothetical protein
MGAGSFVFFFSSIDECFLPHLYPLSLINADYLSASTFYFIIVMYCEIAFYPLFPAMKHPSLADF